MDQWVVWRYKTVPGRGTTKIPFCPREPSRKASSTDSGTWGSFRDAVSVLDADGIGFVFTPDDPFVGVDIDNGVSETGRIHPAVREILSALGGYQEFSPSGRGVHVVVCGTLDRGRHTLKTPWRDELAIYDRGRFFTVSGDGHGAIVDAQTAIDALGAQYFRAPAVSAPVARQEAFSDHDGVIVDRLLADPAGAALWAGDTSAHGNDHSAADLALCSRLALLTANDPTRIDALFRASGLMRDKWDTPRRDMTYGQQTIRRACT